MPLFDYECPDCGHKKEVLFHSTEKVEEIVDCDKCKKKMNRVWGASSFLPETSALHTKIHRAEKVMGTHNLDKSQLPRNDRCKMWPGPGGGRRIH